MTEDELLRGAVNRAVLVVRPAEPFIRWAAGVLGEAVEETRKGFVSDSPDDTAYLIPPSESAEVEPRVLKAIWAVREEREKRGSTAYSVKKFLYGLIGRDPDKRDTLNIRELEGGERIDFERPRIMAPEHVPQISDVVAP